MRTALILAVSCGDQGRGAGAPDRIRTYDLLLRRQTLYPLSYRGAIHDFISTRRPRAN